MGLVGRAGMVGRCRMQDAGCRYNGEWREPGSDRVARPMVDGRW
jgi:hypothetical protein